MQVLSGRKSRAVTRFLTHCARPVKAICGGREAYVFNPVAVDCAPGDGGGERAITQYDSRP